MEDRERHPLEAYPYRRLARRLYTSYFLGAII